jgi:hypothetical protein
LPGLRESIVVAGIGIYAFAFGTLSYFVGTGLRRLQPWARWTETVLMALQVVIGLVQANPVGLIFEIYILYLMLSSKGKMVFSPGYREIIERTPHIRYKISPIVKVLVVLLVAIVAVGIVAAVFGTSGP